MAPRTRTDLSEGGAWRIPERDPANALRRSLLPARGGPGAAGGGRAARLGSRHRRQPGLHRGLARSAGNGDHGHARGRARARCRRASDRGPPGQRGAQDQSELRAARSRPFDEPFELRPSARDNRSGAGSSLSRRPPGERRHGTERLVCGRRSGSPCVRGPHAADASRGGAEMVVCTHTRSARADAAWTHDDAASP